MSILNSARPIARGINVTSTATGAGADVLFSVPNHHAAEVTFLIASNGSGGQQDISIQVYEAIEDAYFYIVRNFTVPNGQYVKVLEGGTLYLKENDKLVAYVDGGSDDIFVSGLLYYNKN